MAASMHCATPVGTLRVRIADNFIMRGLGLLVGPPLGVDEGLLISPCTGVHTMGMRYGIDVVFLDTQARVVRIYDDLRAGRARFSFRSRGVLELRAGTAARHGLNRGLQFPELLESLG